MRKAPIGAFCLSWSNIIFSQGKYLVENNGHFLVSFSRWWIYFTSMLTEVRVSSCELAGCSTCPLHRVLLLWRGRRGNMGCVRLRVDYILFNEITRNLTHTDCRVILLGRLFPFSLPVNCILNHLSAFITIKRQLRWFKTQSSAKKIPQVREDKGYTN